MIYLIDGDSFTGKTTYIKEFIKNNPDKKTVCFTDEEWSEFLIDCVKKVDVDSAFDMVLRDSDVVFIDNVDFLRGKDETQRISAEFIMHLNESADVYLSGISLAERIGIMLCEFERMGVPFSYISYDGKMATSLHRMKLKADPFTKIKNGYKTIELRLNDKKRSLVRVGDEIIFTLAEDEESTLSVRVKAIHRFDSFRTLYETLPLTKCGYTKEELPHADYRDMDTYYSPDEQSRFGVVGIEFELIK